MACKKEDEQQQIQNNTLQKPSKGTLDKKSLKRKKIIRQILNLPSNMPSNLFSNVPSKLPFLRSYHHSRNKNASFVIESSCLQMGYG